LAISTKNRSAIGARVIAGYSGKPQAQKVCHQSSFNSVNDPRRHFGLRQVSIADIDVQWPNGTSAGFKSVVSDRLITIVKSRGIVSNVTLSWTATSDKAELNATLFRSRK
jgi:hypothetical protein